MSRRGKQEGTIYQRKDGRWESRISLPDGGRRSFYGATQKEALAKGRKALAGLDRGRLPPGEELTVARYLDTWLADMANQVRPITVEKYRQHVRDHIVPTVGRLRLVKLAPDDVRRMMRTLEKDHGLSARTVRSVRGTLRHALNQALSDELVDRNVAALTKPPKVQEPERHALTTDEARAILAAVHDDRLEPAVTVALLTGLRQGEQLGLKWPDVDWDARTLTVQRAIQRRPGAGLVEVDPKTAKSRRMVALPDAALAALRRQRALQGRDRLAAGTRWRDTGYVFTSEVGTPLDGPTATRRFQALLRVAGVEPIRWHDLRHGYATIMLALGVPHRTIQEAMGHSTPLVTLSTYMHVPAELLHEAAGRLDEVFGTG